MGLVSNIQRFSIHDGPGIRTTVFLKGCNLACSWCHNPETVSPKPELQYLPDKCIACGACAGVCRFDAQAMIDGKHAFYRERCTVCGECVAVCYAGALELIGKEMTPEEVVAEVMLDEPFYRNSGGGVTVSGGEPLLQVDFTVSILSMCRERGLHTAVETAMAWPWDRIQRVLEFTDLVMMDIKHLSDEEHRKWTGVGNQRILENARKLSQTGIPFIVRTPVVPGVNDSGEIISAIAAFVSELPNAEYYELLPFHPLGSGKYAALGKTNPLQGLRSIEPDAVERLAEEARTIGIRVVTPKGGR